MSDLVSLVVSVRAANDLTLTEYTGQAVNMIGTRWLAAHDPALAEQVQTGDEPRPLTASALIGVQRQDKVTYALAAGGEAWFRLTGLTPDVSRVLLAQAETPPESIDLDGGRLDVTGVTADRAASEWAGQSSYEALAGPYLLARDKGPRRFRLTFAAPTFFCTDGLNQPVPLPDLVFGSLSDRWNAFSSVRINPQAREYAAECVTLNGFRLRSRGVPYQDHVARGAVGEAEYYAVKYDRYWTGVLAMLTDFAFYAGVGYGTAHGFGQVARQLNEAPAQG